MLRESGIFRFLNFNPIQILRVEAANSRLKRWRILKDEYRHPLTNHFLCWRVVLYVYNIDVVRRPLAKDKK